MVSAETELIELPTVSEDAAIEIHNFIAYLIFTGQYVPKVLLLIYDELKEELGIE